MLDTAVPQPGCGGDAAGADSVAVASFFRTVVTGPFRRASIHRRFAISDSGGATMNSYEKVLTQIQELDGAVCSAFVDSSSGMVIASIGSGIDMELAAAGNADVIRAKQRTMGQLKLNDEIGDILVTTGSQYHLLYLCKGIKDLFIYAVFKRDGANLAFIRRNLADIEASLISLLFDDQKSNLQGLNVKTALDAHSAWRDRLRSAIANDGAYERVSPETASSDRRCPLGAWIYETGADAFGKMSEFQHLVKTHAHFHSCAGHVLTTLKERGGDAATAELNDSFQKASVMVQQDLVRFFTTATTKSAA